MTNDAMPFEPWANMTFQPSIIGGIPPEPSLPASSVNRIRALKAAWKHAVTPSDHQPSVAPLTHGTLLESTSHHQPRPSHLAASPLEIILQITIHLPLDCIKSLAQTTHHLRQSIHSSSTISYLQRDHPNGNLVALYLLAANDLNCPTQLTCAACLTHHPLSSFHPWVARHHVTSRSCAKYLRAFHRAQGLRDRFEPTVPPCWRCGWDICGSEIGWRCRQTTPEPLEGEGEPPVLWPGWGSSTSKSGWRALPATCAPAAASTWPPAGPHGG